MHICIFEDPHVKNFYPLSYLRAVYDCHCGTMSLRERIEELSGSKHVVYHVRQFLAGYLREQYPHRLVNEFPDDDTVFINGRIIADPSLRKLLRFRSFDEQVLYSGNEIAIAFVKRDHVRHIASQLQTELFQKWMVESFPSGLFDCRLLQYPWEIVNCNPEALHSDFQRIRKRTRRKTAAGNVYDGAHLLNKKDIIIGKGSVVKPGAVLDAENGPIILDEHVTVMPNSFIEGPVYVGKHSLVKVGAKIYHGTSIGAHCKVGGEIENSIIHSYTNKQHEGFLGHSCLGSWINIGADTNNSDLKNTYGPIKVYLSGRQIDTGLQFVGLTMGDHSKTGINMMFDTGTVVGISCNVYGAGLPPKFIPSFSWGSVGSFSVFELEKSLEVARRMMARRNVQMSSLYEAMMRTVFEATENDRRETLSSK